MKFLYCFFNYYFHNGFSVFLCCGSNHCQDLRHLCGDVFAQPADNPVDEDVRIMKLRLQVDKTPTDAARLDFLTTRERMLTRILNKLNYPQA